MFYRETALTAEAECRACRGNSRRFLYCVSVYETIRERRLLLQKADSHVKAAEDHNADKGH